MTLTIIAICGNQLYRV